MPRPRAARLRRDLSDSAMMIPGKLRRRYGQDPFTDMLFNILLVLSLLFAMALVFINPPAKEGNVLLKAEFIISVTWPDNDPNDIDTWVQDGAGRLCWFKSRDEGLMHLDRDDRGALNDTIVVNGKEIVNPLNQEVVTLRGIEPGEYTVNVHYYKSEDSKAVPVTVQVVKINPRAEVAYYGLITLDRQGQEKTAVRFTLSSTGKVSDLNTEFKPLVRGDKI
jgi:hypothetical protein